MKHALLALALTLVPAFACAHQDRRLSLLADGKLPELPAQYSDARVHIAFTKDSPTKLAGLTFSAGGHETAVKGCALNLVRSGNLSRTALSGSWYHEESLLPHYIQVLFKEPSDAASLSGEPGVLFVFSLRDARLLEVRRVVPLRHERAVQYQQVKLKDGCPD
jgi:hypothetical protein